jgi:type IV pilus assembly protein PilY1
VRVGKGEALSWATNESNVGQCNSANAPSGTINDMTVRVEVCSDTDGPTSARCRQYPKNNSYKPAGLLQQYGEDETIKFGLVSGSYGGNTKGGVLRKNVTPLVGNTDSSKNELDLETGIFNPSSQGIISNINSFSLTQYNNKTYNDCDLWSIGVEQIKSQNNNIMKCSNWGNPLSEIYLEALRYFSGETSATAAFATNNSEPAGSSVENTWVDPIESDEWCVNCSVIVLSTGTNSFDGDDLGTLTDLPGLTEAKLDSNFTDSIGNAEQGGSFSGNYFIGESASSSLDDSTCTAKKFNQSF